MDAGTWLWAILLLPAPAAGLAALLRSPAAVLRAACAGVLATAAVAWVASARVLSAGALRAGGGWLSLDALSAFHLSVLTLIYALSSLFALVYFGEEIRAGTLRLRAARRFAALWLGSLAAMSLVLVSENLGLMWVGIEATTISTAFLICVHPEARSLEATWKYLLICSVGVAFAFMGTLLLAASTERVPLGGGGTLGWGRLLESAASLDPGTVKAGFLFLLVGYGTKVGLAPLHGWLPDAHSQAPAPVSAIFSGFMLNTALYCILRTLPIAEAATGRVGWASDLLLGFGGLSVVVAAAFIVTQHDLKRLLAYHSVEHLGIIALGAGLGRAGVFAALLHTLNHALCKALGFFCAGRLGQLYGTHDMRQIAGSLRGAPAWGGGLLASFLALIGAAPFAIFLSELLILRAAIERGSVLAALAFLAGAGIVFAGALRHAIAMAWGDLPAGARREAPSPLSAALVLGPLAALLLLGIWVPGPLREALESAADLVEAPR
ncbi:MAG: hypothetical protein L0216_19880 [Planctomycetales bacterium]|nr:hypothetical protein [Planctomycetales bacterium]